MNKRLNKLGKGQDAMTLEITMANVSVNNRIKNQQEEKDKYTNGTEDRYSESYWAEVI
jgi:hypothetical protein